jgi:hypothetical protein
MNNDVQTEHMKKRCYFILVLCSMSLYNWYNYSLFAPVNNDFFTMYYQNCLLMLFYLCWDIYHMVFSTYKSLLFRTDLIIHHIITFIIFIICINYGALQMNSYLIMECISLMNYIWRNNPTLLKFYRTFCILFIRIPLITWYFLYYNPYIILPIVKNKLSLYEYISIYIIEKFHIFFIVYDIFILFKLYKPNKVIKLND